MIKEKDKVRVDPESLIEHNDEVGIVIAVDNAIGSHHIKVRFKSIGVTDWIDSNHFIKVLD